MKRLSNYYSSYVSSSADVWEYHDADFNALPELGYKVEPGVNVTLPASPDDHDQIWFAPAGDMASNNATILRNGNNINKTAEDLIWNVNSGFSIVYDATISSWVVM